MRSKSGAGYAVTVAAMLVIAAAGSVVVYEIARIIPNAPGTGPHAAYLAMIRTAPIPVVQEATGWGVLLAVWAMFALLAAIGIRLTRSIPDTQQGPAAVLLAFGLVAAILWFFPIAQSIDVYYYTAYGRLYGLYGINPYDLHSQITLADPTLAANLIPLQNPPFADSYGPGFTLLAGLIGRLEAAAPLWWQLVSWRVVSTLAAVVALLGLAKMIGSRAGGERTARLGAFAFNPLVLYEAAVGGHNDLLMVAPAVWAFALVDETPLFAGLLIGAAIAIKYMAVVAAPFLAIRAFKRNRVAGALLVALAIFVPAICARPFAFGQDAAATLATVGSQLSMSLTWLATLPFFKAGIDQMPVVAGLPVLPFLGTITWPRLIQLGTLLAFGCVAIWSIAAYAHREQRGPVYRSIAALLLALPAMHPWYLTWLSPALADRGAWKTYTAWLFALGLLVYAHEGVQQNPVREVVFVGITLVMLVMPVVVSRWQGSKMAQKATAIKPS